MLAVKGLAVLTGAVSNSVIFREIKIYLLGRSFVARLITTGDHYITSLSVSHFSIIQDIKLCVPMELLLEGGGLYLRVARDIIIFSLHFSISTPYFACIALTHYERIISSLEMNTGPDLKSPNELLCLKHE
jgi:hypothetical protein